MTTEAGGRKSKGSGLGLRVLGLGGGGGFGIQALGGLRMTRILGEPVEHETISSGTSLLP